MKRGKDDNYLSYYLRSRLCALRSLETSLNEGTSLPVVIQLHRNLHFLVYNLQLQLHLLQLHLYILHPYSITSFGVDSSSFVEYGHN